MQTLKACRACLVTDVKMYDLDNPSISNAYLELMDLIKFSPPHYICYECTAFLKKFEQFRYKCMRAHALLKNINIRQSKITMEILSNIDRKKNKLESALKYSTIKTYDTHPDLIICNGEEKILLDTVKTEIDLEQENTLEDLNNKFTVDTEVLAIKNDENNLQDTEDYFENVPSPDITTDSPFTRKRKLKTANVKKKICKYNKVEGQNNEDCVIEDIDSALNNSEVAKKTRPKFDESYFEGYATVVLLTPEQAKNEVLHRKESSNYRKCQYKCDLCYRGFEAQGTYENHMKKHSPKYGEYECDFCHLRFPQQRFLCKHRLTSHKRKFYCKICPYTCFCTDQAKTHISLHKGKTYPCKECGEIFSMPNSLLMHKRIKHPTKCACDMCGSTFATDRGLRSHKMLLHRQESNEKSGPSCQECDGVQFANETAYKRHLVLSSRHTVSHGCESCGETFETAGALKAHARRTHARKQPARGEPKLPAECTLCGEWLRDRSERRSHLLSAHADTDAARRLDADDAPQCVCEVCGKMFKKRCFLVYHQRAHTGERPYRCGDCGKTYAFPGALSVHRGTHAAAARHHCHLCSKHFTFRSALNKHLKAHMGIRPHKCSICDKSFPSPCDVRLHTQYVHHKVPWPKRERARRQPDKQPAQNTPYAYDH